MKLYWARGTCSLSPHIVARELGLPVEIERVDLRHKKTAGGEDFLAINEKGQVPTLRLDDGAVLTEGAVIVQYLADRKPDAGLLPPPGSEERYRALEWLNWVAAELHKTMGSLFNRKMPEEWRAQVLAQLDGKLGWVARKLEGRPYLLGDRFTVPDAYLFTVLGWAKLFDIDLGRWPSLQAYVERVGARPAVRAALEAEGAH